MVLRVASSIYDAITRVRNFAYDRGWLEVYRSPLKVISVGNITAGGNGKTPLCLLIVKELRNAGFSPVILTRGYGGSTKSVKKVTEEDGPAEVGDEAVMLFRRTGGPVVIGANRVQAVKMIESERLGDIVLLDDGFQHRRLARDVDIVTINVGSDEAVMGFLRG